MSDWHEKETKRLNKQSMRRAVVASFIIVGLAVWWFVANEPPHVAQH